MPNDIPPLGTKEYLVALRDTCNSIIRALHSERNGRLRSSAVNWGDLSCIGAYWTRDDEGAEFASVIISEASPDAGVFRAAVYDALVDEGFKGVEVRTEW